jgi:hypothetical protein
MAANWPDTQGGSAAAGGGFDLSWLGPFATLLGAGSSAFAQSKAGGAQREMYDYNAQAAEYQATDAIERGVVAAKRRGRITKQVIGSQRAGLAAQNVDINDPGSSAVDVQADAAYLGELDAMTIKNNAAREAWGFKVQAQDYRNRGRYAEMTGTNQASNTLLTAGSSLLLAKYGMKG